MAQPWKVIPPLESLDFDYLVRYRAEADECSVGDVLKFISQRPSLQSGLELLGVTLFGGSVLKRERSRTEVLLQAFGEYLFECGYEPPELKWEPIGLTIFDPVLNEDAHRLSGEKRRSVLCS